MMRETCKLFLKLTISAVVLAILREQSCLSKNCKLLRYLEAILTVRICSIPARRNWARAGMVEWNGIFRLFQFSLGGCPKILECYSGKLPFHSLPVPEFPEFLVEWKAPNIFFWENQHFHGNDKQK